MVNYQTLPATLPEPSALGRALSRGLLGTFLHQLWTFFEEMVRRVRVAARGLLALVDKFE